MRRIGFRSRLVGGKIYCQGNPPNGWPRLAIAAKFTVSGNSPVASKVKKRRIAATGQWAEKSRSI